MKRLLRAVTALGLGLCLCLGSATTSPAASLRDRLRGAPVPSMCQYPAGLLVAGSLPGTGAGNVDLDLSRSKLGTLVPDGGTGAAAVFSCSQGGVGWPDHVVFYDSALRIIGHFDSFSVGVQSGRAQVARVTIGKAIVTIDTLAIGQDGDSDLWGSAGAKITYAWDARLKAMTRRGVTVYRDSDAAKQLLTLVRAKALTKARRLADADVVRGLRALVVQDAASRRKWVTFSGCIGALSELADNYAELLDGNRGCFYTIHRRDARTGDDHASGYLVRFTHPSHDSLWKRWHASGWSGVSG